MTIDKVLQWLQSNISAPKWYAGRLASPGEQTLVVYNGRAFTNPRAIGGLSSYGGKGLRVLIHWTKDLLATEIKAQEVYEFLMTATGTIDNKRIIDVLMREPEPVYLGADEEGIFEYVIDAELILEK